MAPNRCKYIVGLDFGTTFTGVSHVDSTKSSIDDIQVIRNWPGPSKEFDEVWKTPSKIAYRGENPKFDLGNDKETIWGYQVVSGMQSYSWMKLRLDQDTRLTDFDDLSLVGLPSSREGIMQLPTGKDATQVCADYLVGVYKYTMAELERIWGTSIINITPIDFWLTIPATWSDKAKGLTRVAAMKAGFGSRTNDSIYMISEPEAAVVATLSGLVVPGIANQIETGDGVLICDCGGGTVDRTTYVIKETTPKLEFEELVVGQGAKIGSSYIDRQFHFWPGSRFGVYFERLEYKKKGPVSRLMREFESLKRDFGGSRNRQDIFEVPLMIPGIENSEYYDTDEYMVKFTRKDMEAFFMASVSSINKLVLDQLTKANMAMKNGRKISMVVLVGGYGDSQYLHDAMKKLCETNGGVRLLCPPHPQAAIVKGAALRGLGDVAPSRRVCHRFYGFACGLPFRFGVDPNHRRYENIWNNEQMCINRMKWQISKGDYMDDTTTISYDMNKVHQSGDSMTCTRKLYSCDEDQAPDYSDVPGVDVVGTMELDYGDIDFSQFERKLSPKTGVLQVTVKSGGKEVGSADFDFNKLENGMTG